MNRDDGSVVEPFARRDERFHHYRVARIALGVDTELEGAMSGRNQNRNVKATGEFSEQARRRVEVGAWRWKVSEIALARRRWMIVGVVTRAGSQQVGAVFN